MTPFPSPAASVPATAIVMTRQAAPLLADCLAALVRFDQIIVVDSDSTDGTRDLVGRAAADLIGFRWNGRYPKKKQWCLAHPLVRHDLVLFVDADERPPSGAIDEIASIARSGGTGPAAWTARLRPGVAGRVLRFGRGHRKIVLLDRRRCRFGAIDDLDAPAGTEVEGHYQPSVAGPIGRLRHAWRHDVGTPSDWTARHDRYARTVGWLEAHGRPTVPPDEAQPPGRRRLKRLTAALPGRTLLAFLDSWVLCLGVLDGRAGLDWAVMRAWYYWRIGVERRRYSAGCDDPGGDVARAISAADSAVRSRQSRASARPSR